MNKKRKELFAMAREGTLKMRGSKGNTFIVSSYPPIILGGNKRVSVKDLIEEIRKEELDEEQTVVENDSEKPKISKKKK